MNDTFKLLTQLCAAPASDEEYVAWLEMKDALLFLETDPKLDSFVVYASFPYGFMHAITVPNALLDPPDKQDLMRWNFTPDSSWSISMTHGEASVMSIHPPLHDSDSKTLSQGEQLVFTRYFEGRIGEKRYVEVAQKLTHLFGLHYLRERNAFCQLDENGDIENLISLATLPGARGESGGMAVLVKRSIIDEFLTLTGSAIVRMFDFVRYKSPFSGWKTEHKRDIQESETLFYWLHVDAGYASYVRGCQVVRSKLSGENLIKKFQQGDEREKEYADFIAFDWKNNVVEAISCAPGHTSNYFTDSILPFETSPVFFKPEVLGKYKANTDKYTLTDRSITCRGSWSLQTYDINEAGQVHTYIVYLSHLPYQEQLYWKSYNEKPKGSISQRALKSDFEASWDTQYEPLSNLKIALADLETKRAAWWQLRSANLPERVHYPVTDSPDEWANELLQLDQLVNEGFETKWIRDKAKNLRQTIRNEWKSLVLIQECLLGLGFSEVDAKSAVLPLRDLANLRSKLKGHASGEEATQIKMECLSKHGSYLNHFKVLCAQIDNSVRLISETLQTLK